MEDEERQKKLEAGKAKLAQFRQRKADGQNTPKKQKKKKKMSNSKEGEPAKDGPDINLSERDETCTQSSEKGAGSTTKVTIMRTIHGGDIIRHDQTFTIEPESEISTTADDYSSEVNGCSFETRTKMPTNLLREEEFGVPESYSEHEMQNSQTRLEVMEDELVGKQEIEELNRELEEIRAVYGTEGLQQLQEFEAAIKQRDGIITQLTTNLQQAQKEKDEIMREFLELTEQSQKLKIQFQHLQASETLRNSSHTSTAADLLLAKQQILTYQQQLDEQDHHLKTYQKQIEEYQVQHANKMDSNEQKLQEKDAIIERLKTSLTEKEKSVSQFQEKVLDTDRSLKELREQISQKNQETNSLTAELSNSKQKEKQSSDEVKQLMGTVEELQKCFYNDSQSETDIVQRMELEAQRKLEHLQAELDEMYGQQIVQMKQELMKQHTFEINKILAQHNEELEKISSQSGIVKEEQINIMNRTINELNVKLQDANHQRDKIKRDLSQQIESISAEKSLLHKQVESLLQDLSFAREQMERAKECKLAETNKFQVVIEDLKAQAVSTREFTKELELKHDSEITNYKIKLEMLEREKDEVLDRMAESQEAELERLRTQLLFSHEEELSNLREDLEREHRTNTENLKDNLSIQYKQQLEGVQNEMSQKIEAMQYERDNLITKQNELMLEISKLNDLQQSILNSKSEEMTLQISELQKEIETLRKEEKEKGTLEQEVQELYLKVDLLEKEMKDKEDKFNGKFALLEEENKVLKDENIILHEKINYSAIHTEEHLLFMENDSRSPYIDLQRKVEMLSMENEQLRKQGIQLKEEIERQRNTFSFAEKNFEVNYQELQEEYTCLLKVKSELEEDKYKQEAEYESKLKTLNEELRFIQTNNHAMFKMKSTELEDCKDAFEGGEVVEKDTTELMEKLEVVKHENLELTLRLSDLSEQLNLKQIKIDQLHEELRSLKEEKEQVKGKEQEMMIQCNQSECVKLFEEQIECQEKITFIDIPISNQENFYGKIAFRQEAKLQSPFRSSDQHEIMERQDLQQENLDLIEENQSLLDRLHELTSKLAGESLLTVRIQSENSELRQHLELLQSEQSDLRLQMEAQRISLTQVYNAHLEMVREDIQKEKENALCSLREELVTDQEQETQELHKLHQQEILELRRQQADLKEQLKIMLSSLEETEKVKMEFSEQRRQLEEQHVQDIEHLRSYFQQQLKETEERYTTEIIHLQERLQDINEPALQFRKLAELVVGSEQEESESNQRVYVPNKDASELDEMKLIEECERPLQGQSGPIQQLQILRQVLHRKYTEEVNALKKQHSEELERHMANLKELQSLENTSLKEEVVQLSKHKQKNLNGDVGTASLHLSSDLEKKEHMDDDQFWEKRYQEKVEEEIAKVIVELSIAFAQQTELARIARQKKDIEDGKNEDGQENKKDIHKLHERVLKKTPDKYVLYEEQLCEIGGVEHLVEQTVFQSNEAHPEQLLSHSDQNIENSAELCSKDKEYLLNKTVFKKMIVSSSETSNLHILYEEHLEDMRQELVRQEQEHQQAIEALRQAHMLQMERQREDQEQLLAELEILKVQLAKSTLVVNENLPTEREKMLLEERETLKKTFVSDKKLYCDLQNKSTQTQEKNENQDESKEHTFDEEVVASVHGRLKETSSSVTKERQNLQKAHNKLLKILIEIAKTTIAVEKTIGCHVLGLLNKSPKDQSSSRVIFWNREPEEPAKPCTPDSTVTEELTDSYQGSDMSEDDTSLWSGGTKEGLELSLRLMDLAGLEREPENEEAVLNISTRLQAAVEKLLEVISETNNQLDHAKAAQTELIRESIKRKEEISELLKCQEDLQERLSEEAKARERLALELSRAEGLLDGYTDEKDSLEKQMQEKTHLINHLEQELQGTGNRLQELEDERRQILEERELLARQKDAMKAEAGSAELRVDAAVDAAPQAELLEETEKLMKEKIEVQRQAEKEHDYLQKQVKGLEADLEEQVNSYIELEQEKNAELADLRQQNQALERQLDKMRKFLDEQAVDREHERDVFQQEIQKLEQQLKTPQRLQPTNDHQTKEVEKLTNNLKEKSDKCSELLLSQEQLQRDVQERNEELEKLESRIRELEQALIISADHLQKMEERKLRTIFEVKGELPLEAQLQVEREAIDRKEREITNLEEQLEQFREELENKNEEVQQLHMQLEIQRKESTTRLQELEQENKLFKDDMENLRQTVQPPKDDASVKDRHLLPGKFAHVMQEKDQEIDQLNEQILKLQQQLELGPDNKVIEEKNDLIKELEAQTEYLRSDQERLRKNSEEEIEQLNEVIEKLQQELANIEQKIPIDFSSAPLEADSLKHQLDMVTAEKEVLQQEVILTKNELEETRTKMNLLKEEIDTLKNKLESVTKGHIDIKNDNVVAKGDINKIEMLEEALRDKSAQFSTYEALLRSVEANTHDTVSSMEIKLQELQAANKGKDMELSQCYIQIETLKEQAKSERDLQKQKLFEMENALRENVAAALVSQVQLKAVQEQIRLRQVTETVSMDSEEPIKSTQIQSRALKIDETTDSKLSVLTIRLSGLEHELEDVHKQLAFEKEQVGIAQKEALDKEKELSELQHVLKQLKDRQKEEVEEKLRKEKMDTFKVVAASADSKGEGSCTAELELELEKTRAEAAFAKEELNSYREKAEKLEDQLLVKEASIAQLQEDLHRVKETLIQADQKMIKSATQEKQLAKLGGKTTIDEFDCAASKEKAHLLRQNSSSQTDKAMNVCNSNQTSQIDVKDAEIQNDLPFFPNVCSSEEIAEVISQYTEKIEQMQELHAAEIMDMEARHITEAETLKREQFDAVQALTEECDALKAVIESLTTKGVIIPGLAQTNASQIRDGYPSGDIGSDWNQGNYSAPSQKFDIVSEDSREESRTSVDMLSNKIKVLLNAVHQEGVQVLSLTELPSAEKEVQSAMLASKFWLEERNVFLGTIASLKDVIAKMQVHPQAEESTELSIHVQDWRGELLDAVQEVFLKEANVLRAAFHTQLASLGTTEAVVLVSQLEDRVQEQDTERSAAMDYIQSADRRSLLLEIQALHSEINSIEKEGKMKQSVDTKSQEQPAHSMLQELSPVLVDLNSVKKRAAELQDQLNSEKMLVAELKNELAQTKLELGTTLKAQHKHFKEVDTLRLEVAEKATELERLNDTLANEQKKMRELQWALEKEKAKMERLEERGREELEDLKLSVEDHNLKNIQLNKFWEQEKQVVNELQQKIESQKSLYETQLSQEQRQNSEFQVLLEAQKDRAVELASALEREKELRVQLQICERSGKEEKQKPQEELLKDLQSQLDEKHNRIVELVSETEKCKLECVQMRQRLEEDQKIQRRILQAEQEANSLANRKVQQLESEAEELRCQLEEKIWQIKKLQQERKLLEEKIQDLQNKEQERENKQVGGTHHDLNETICDSSNDQTRNRVFQKKTDEAETKQSTNISQLNGGDAVTDSNQGLESILQRLQLVSSKLKQLANKAASRVPFEAEDDEDFVWSHNTIQDVLSQLKQLPGLALLGQIALPPAGSCSSLTEMLLHQNAELTGYVSRLTEEKNDLRNALIKLEEQFRHYKQRGPSGDQVRRHSLDNEVNDALLASEREIWNKEKLALQKSLKQTEAELCKLRAELRNEAFLRDLGADSENQALKRIYGKYLRAESYRKALIYQKKYLLLLLGGFQECEQATLCLIARMGGQPCYTDLEIITNHSRAFTKFRSAVRVSIAISRMKFLVRRWQRVIGSCSISANRNDFGQSSGNEMRTDSPYFPHGGLDPYGDQRLSSSRSRSDLESPRSTVTSQHRYQIIPADLGPCSHLQNYDPDRALTDYINRLEALQRRLGSVHSGSTTSTSTHSHYGTRR